MKALEDVSAAQLAEKVNENKVVVVDFYTPACVICKKIEPMLVSLQERITEGLEIVKVNAEAQQDVAAQYSVRGVPFMVLIKDGAVADQKVGFATMSDLRGWVEPHLA